MKSGPLLHNRATTSDAVSERSERTRQGANARGAGGAAVSDRNNIVRAPGERSEA
jgi:hypothetical protein